MPRMSAETRHVHKAKRNRVAVREMHLADTHSFVDEITILGAYILWVPDKLCTSDRVVCPIKVDSSFPECLRNWCVYLFIFILVYAIKIEIQRSCSVPWGSQIIVMIHNSTATEMLICFCSYEYVLLQNIQEDVVVWLLWLSTIIDR